MKNQVIIVGGGLNGAALALALASVGQASLLIDALPAKTRADPGFDGRAYALALSSQRMLAALGLWGGLADVAERIAHVKVADGRPNSGANGLHLHFNADELDGEGAGFMVEDRHLRPALLAAIAKQKHITHLAPAKVVGQSISPNAVAITLQDGSTHEGALLVGCDGRASEVAARAGIMRQGHDYGQTALVCALSHEKPHFGTAYQLFLPAGPLAVLPLKGNRCSIVWSESAERAATISAMDDAGYMAALRPVFGNFLGKISLSGARFSYPLSLTLASELTRPRLALVGDAAHGIHPLAGQGLNLGLRDVASLAEVLCDASRRGEDIGSDIVLARYGRWRRSDIAANAIVTDGVNHLFSNDNLILRAGRSLGLGLVNSWPGLRRRLMEEAAGTHGNLPRLMQGQGL
ncbi:MAG: UbiH/UbiF/VisC/COQ6 family ubiquinone biosynthesis hydroxylase [Paracoccaceae bacterium]